MSIRLDYHVKQKQCMKLLGIHHRLHQLAVLLLRLDPRLSGSSSGLLFPIIVWARLFIYHFDTHFYSHRRLAGSDSCPERWQADQPTVPKVQVFST